MQVLEMNRENSEVLKWLLKKKIYRGEYGPETDAIARGLKEEPTMELKKLANCKEILARI